MSLLYKYNVQMDVNTLLFWRTLIVLDATALMLLPDFAAGDAWAFFLERDRPMADRISAALWNRRQLTEKSGCRRISRRRNRARELTAGRVLATIQCRKESTGTRQVTYATQALGVAVLALTIALIARSGGAHVITAAVGGLLICALTLLWLRRAILK